jgi:chemotaxis protein methyltransferase CheR
VSDNGIGKAAPVATGSKGGLGTSLIQALAKQLDARVDTTSDTSGTTVAIVYAAPKVAAPSLTALSSAVA